MGNQSTRDKKNENRQINAEDNGTILTL